MKTCGTYKIQHMIHQTVFSTYQSASSHICTWTEHMKLISIINNVGVMLEQLQVEFGVKYSYQYKILRLRSAIHKLATSAVYLWTIKTKVILVILISYQISLISLNSSSNYSVLQIVLQNHPVVLRNMAYW